ncbi:hypothetical protein CIHG_04264 [Coccidioides immitis H538.4]|uniref:Uncharacterized protein n=3 Tax=Coccidioides immitis TaxID=5501 RepID=A0A0J8TW80_COCIT|nr:hypothetical protein CIRG_04654 [Coccidioides immitis RMSCC 2394]KMU78167.1 hypothetical protein CISG_07008 [Coccidioides immitis RMSCC 3703]KMU86475.1 hypothetical protein CIHG_04264 [Coccidioides immitis H538.4]
MPADHAGGEGQRRKRGDKELFSANPRSLGNPSRASERRSRFADVRVAALFCDSEDSNEPLHTPQPKNSRVHVTGHALAPRALHHQQHGWVGLATGSNPPHTSNSHHRSPAYFNCTPLRASKTTFHLPGYAGLRTLSARAILSSNEGGAGQGAFIEVWELELVNCGRRSLPREDNRYENLTEAQATAHNLEVRVDCHWEPPLLTHDPSLKAWQT